LAAILIHKLEGKELKILLGYHFIMYYFQI